MDEAQCKRQLRFLLSHMYDFKKVLNIPGKIVTFQRIVSSGFDALCVLLKRLAFPCRYTDMVHSWLLTCSIISTLNTIIVCNHGTNIFYNQQSYESMLIIFHT